MANLTDDQIFDLSRKIHEALKSPEGVKFKCTVKVDKHDNNIVIYQGSPVNIWGRIFKDGSFIIYRNKLEELLRSSKETKDYFTPNK